MLEDLEKLVCHEVFQGRKAGGEEWICDCHLMQKASPKKKSMNCWSYQYSFLEIDAKTGDARVIGVIPDQIITKSLAPLT